ncbi:nitroreductase family protein with 4Fe-4S ferredoxin iron-sulfur binding domain [Gottschalkia acidurici 9a]|uniref:Nitroreductase family protein with 4Fe-4S ferredoxin iron-sulfur binding domain n=1 Tax=Gottschalkia acidurici (strain ATCC 7906 / DSM 604 / BCRC 14475 / CIP 104303 / KCTC 5404 / NCIMB 10678 / 9a) TaxID=1128398 RepID=K0AY65_GOTA9|nr:nitroreductase family protein [Gottschalkia acidurici]AFS77700.1 nitroreductase family protein with 4Fe-4S ferredoxin iron-sulfur binding domain [Gottschalkia acidurici 9a]
MIKIDDKKCIVCGQCVKDCFLRDIEIVDNKVQTNNVTCIKCGHCIAVCPTNAVSIDEYNMEEVKDYNKDEFSIDSDNLLNFIKFRRTVRQFKNKEVEKEKILKIIEAGRFTQTGSNMQNISYIVVREGLQELKSLAFKSLKKKGEELISNTTSSMAVKRFGKLWIDMYKEHEESPNKNDKLFFNAPAVIIVAANTKVDGALASSNMELMTNALGLGTLFSGFFVMAAQEDEKIMDFLGVEKDKQIVTCMIIGYPDVKYLRTVPRKEADISWI